MLMDVESYKEKHYVDYRKPINININKQECQSVYTYLHTRVQLLCLNELVELMVFEKILEVLKKLMQRIQSYKQVRKCSISYTQAKAIIYLYRNYASENDHLTNLTFVNVFMQIDKQI